MKVQTQLVKAFTKDSSQGNPAAVIHDANDLSDAQMLQIAQHFGFSESAFIQTSDKTDYKLRFFSVKEEVDFCGHATVATFFSLLSAGKINPTITHPVTVTQETGIGVLPVTCFADGKIMMAQKSPIFGEILTNKSAVASLLSIDGASLMDMPIQIVSTGVKKLIVPVNSLATMRLILPNLEAIVEHSTEHDYSGIAVITTETFSGINDIATRNFSPSVGINEDPATGIAAGPIACYADKYLYERNRKQLVVEQGFDMNKASIIYIDITKEVLVGGYAASFGNEAVEV